MEFIFIVKYIKIIGFCSLATKSPTLQTGQFWRARFDELLGEKPMDQWRSLFLSFFKEKYSFETEIPPLQSGQNAQHPNLFVAIAKYVADLKFKKF